MSTNILWDFYPDGFYARITYEECNKIAGMDAKSISTDSNYAKRNSKLYYLVANLWCNLAFEVGYAELGYMLATYMKKFGMIRTIKDCSSCASEIIQGGGVGNDVDHIDEILSVTFPALRGSVVSWSGRLQSYAKSDEAYYWLLLILRFANRFSPDGADRLKKDSIRDFFACNRCNDIHHNFDVARQDGWNGCHIVGDPDSRGNYQIENRSVFTLFKEACDDWFFEFDPARTFYVYADYLEAPMPEGATQDTCNNPLCKRMSFDMLNGRENPYTPKWIPIDWIESEHEVSRVMNSDGSWRTVRRRTREYLLPRCYFEHLPFANFPAFCVTPTAVNKSWKASRIIGKQPMWVYSHADAIRRCLVETLCAKPLGEACNDTVSLYYQEEDVWLTSNPKVHGIITCDHSGVNRERALKGSIDRSLDTIDMSHASDRVRSMYFWYLIPDDVAALLRYVPFCSYFINEQGQRVRSRMLAPAGDPRTFICECLSHAVPCEVAYRLCEFAGLTDLQPYSIHGDDIVCDSRCTETVIDCLEFLGLQVNQDKTYRGDHPYRESCGGEYSAGYNLSTLYWPRNFTSPNAANSEWLLSLRSLNNRLYSELLGVRNTESPVLGFLRQYIRKFAGKVHFSECSADEPYFLGEASLCVYRDADFKVQNGTVGQAIGFPMANTMIRAKALQDRKCNASCPCQTLTQDEQRAWYDFYMYQRFLADGPQYEDQLMELLGCSQRPQTFEEAVNTKSYSLKSRF